MTDFYSKEDLLKLVDEVGEDVRVHKTALFFNSKKIKIGNNVRIDANSIISGNIEFGNHIHIATAAQLYGGAGIYFQDFSGCGARGAIYSQTDEYIYGGLIGPHIYEKYRNVRSAPVILEKHAAIGTNSTILPGVTLKLGSVVGAHCLIRQTIPEYAIVFGNPPKVIGKRSDSILHYEKQFLEDYERSKQNKTQA